MKKRILLLSMLYWSAVGGAAAQDFETKAKAYVQQYAGWAMEEQQRVGIPAAITLAQGIYETGAGESELAVKANNHFGIKCKRNWTGATFLHTDDAPNECFRKYPSAKDSYIDHSDYLKQSTRYAELFTYNVENYKAWAKGLRRCGYATNPAYATRLIKMVEDFDLQQYTLAAKHKRKHEVVPVEDAASIAASPAPAQRGSIANIADRAEQKVMGDGSGVVEYNHLRAFYAEKGASPLDKADQYNIRYARLLEVNELADEPLPWSTHYYLEPKRLKGERPTHIVKEGETVEIIAHQEGMWRRQVRLFNHLNEGEQPLPGEVLQLQAIAEFRPRTYVPQTSSTAVAKQRFRLIEDKSAGNGNDDYVPTHKIGTREETPRPAATVATPSASTQTEEIEIGFGAAPSPSLQQKPAPEQIKKTPKQEQVTAIQQEAPVAEAAMDTTIPQVLEEEKTEPKDEFELLKEKLDRVVYARSSKSNIKVSSSDSSALYGSKPAPTATVPKAQGGQANANAVYHVVEKGETGYSIAKKYKITVKQLNEWNGLDFGAIKVGQKLRVH